MSSAAKSKSVDLTPNTVCLYKDLTEYYNYLLPIVSIGVQGKLLYHILSRFGHNNKNLANLAQTWGLRT